MASKLAHFSLKKQHKQPIDVFGGQLTRRNKVDHEPVWLNCHTYAFETILCQLNEVVVIRYDRMS